jgi:hypothetical protein
MRGSGYPAVISPVVKRMFQLVDRGERQHNVYDELRLQSGHFIEPSCRNRGVEL